MRAVTIRGHGGPEVLTLEEVEQPRPGPHDAVVEVTVSGVNFIDVYHRTGMYTAALPFIPGVEAVGVVREVGDQVTQVRVGDRVGWVKILGGYAERAVIPAERLIPLSPWVKDEEAAAVLLQGITAHYLTHDTYRIKPGDTALVHAAAGGLGMLLTQVIKLRGGRVIGTVSSPEKEKQAREAGADDVIRYTEVDFAAEVRRLTGGEGVAVVYDGVGRATFEGSLASLRRCGVLALYGQASGPVSAVSPSELAQAGSVYLTRPRLSHHIATRAELLGRSTAVLNWVSSGQLQVHIGGRYSLEQAAVAHQALQGRHSVGKLLLYP